MRLGDATGNEELDPGRAASRAQCATLHPVTMFNRQPGCSVGGDVNVTVQAAALCSLTVIREDASAIAATESITAVTSGRAYDVLRAIINGFALIHRSR